MIPLAQLKKDLVSSQNLADTIDMLKLIASSEFSNLSLRMPKEDAQRKHIISCFDLLASASDDNPFLVEKKGVPPGFLMICSDEGFLGEINANIVNMALRRGSNKDSRFIVLGERGAGILKDSGVKFAAFPGVENHIDVDRVKKITDYIIEMYKKEEISSLHVIYMKYRSFTSHQLDMAKLLPCNDLGGYINKDKEAAGYAQKALVEPHPYHVIEYLVKLWLENNLYNIFWSSKLSEWSIKALHLEHSSDELKEINKDLKFKYFRSVLALNDKVIREIFAARAAT